MRSVPTLMRIPLMVSLLAAQVVTQTKATELRLKTLTTHTELTAITKAEVS